MELSRHEQAVKDLLDRWANWIGQGGFVTEGLPRQCPGAPDARIHSFEDLEIETEKTVVNAVHTAVWELPEPQRLAVTMFYGFCAHVWRIHHDDLFKRALQSLYIALRHKIVVEC